MTTFDALGLPIFATTDKIAATGDGLREDLNLITASAGNAITAEGARAQADATAAAQAYTDSNKFKRGTIPAGTDIYSYEGSGKDGVYSSLLASNTATLLNLPTELVTSPRPFILTVKTLTNTVVLTIEIISVTGTVTYKANSSPSTGTGWTVWERQLNDKDLPALTPGDDGPDTVTTPSAFKNVALALTVPANASATESVPAASLRYPIRYGAPFGRWRFHIQNINDRSGTTYPGAVAFTGAWFGAGSHTTGNGTGAPAKVADAFTLPEDGSEYVSPWITSAPVVAGASYHLSFGYTADVAQVNTQSTAAVWRTTTPGNASVASPSGQTLSTDSPFSVWIEAEVPAGIPVVGMLGASGPAGVGSTLPVLESPVSIYARSIGAFPMHYAHPGSTLAIWKDETHQKWRKWLGYARPDALIVDGASNDVYGSNALPVIQADTATVLDIAARLATPNLYAMTVHPRDNTTDEAKRRDYNTWLKTMPLGLRDVFDQSAAVSSDDETVLPAYYADGVHTNTAGATAKAGAITRQVVTTPAAPTKAALGLDQVDNTSDANKPVSGPQAAELAGKVGKGELLVSVKDHGAVGNGVADDSAAINAALATGATTLHWPAGTYLIGAAANVSGLEGVNHTGTAVISKGGNQFRIGGKRSLSQRNTLYVSPAGVDANDGLSAATPFKTLAKAAAVVNAWADGGLDGLWRVQLAAGTYTQDRFLLNSMVKSDYPVEVRGPSVGGHPNVPTAIIDNSGGTSDDIFGNGYNSWLNVQDVKVINHAAGNAFHVSRGLMNLTNCHVSNVYTGVVYEHNAGLGLFGGLWDGGNIAGGAGIRGYYGSTHNLVTADLTTSVLFTNWAVGLQIGEGCFGHLDYVRIWDCPVGVNFNRVGSGANTKQMQIWRCGVGVQAWNSAWFNNVIDFGLGTANACTVTVDERGDSPEYAFRAQNNTSRTTRQMDTYRGANRTGNTNKNAEYTALTFPAGRMSNAVLRAGHTTRIAGTLITTVTAGSTITLSFRLGAVTTDEVSVVIPPGGAVARTTFNLEIVSFAPNSHRMVLTANTPAGTSVIGYKEVTADANASDLALALYYQLGNVADSFSVISASCTTTVGG